MTPTPSYGFRLTVAALATALILGSIAAIAVVVALIVGWWFPLVAVALCLLAWIGPRWWVAIDPENPLLWVWALPKLWRWVAAARVSTR
jgi:hypothetical protein